MSALGQNVDMCSAHVRFTPESGHVQCTSACLLWANSGLMQCSKRQNNSINLVGAGEVLLNVAEIDLS